MHGIQKIGKVLLVGGVLFGLADSAALNKVYAAPPTATLVVSNKALKIGDTSTLTITFSEAVFGFSAADLTSANVEIGEPSSTDGGITWTATLTPHSDVEAWDQTVTLDNTGVMNLANESNAGTTVSDVFLIDTLRPTLRSPIMISDTALKIGDSATVAFVFKEAVTGFTAADLTVPNGTLSNLASRNGGFTWTATLTPSTFVADATNVLTLHYGGIADTAGNTGTGTVDSPSYAIDTIRPTLASDIEISNTTLNTGSSANVTFTFTEPVTGFTTDDIDVPNGTLSDLASSNGGFTWTAKLTPDSDVSDATNVLTLDYGGLADLAGNSGAGTVYSMNYAVNTKNPVAQSITVSDTMLTIGETTNVTFKFTQPVSGFTTADLKVPNGIVSDLSSNDGGITWTGTLTPNINTQASGGVITLDNTGIFNASGNQGVGTMDSNAYDVDTLRPTATISLSRKTLNVGATAEVTIAFSEAIKAFTKEDLTAPNGTLSPVTSADGGMTWTATLTPKANVASRINAVVLENGAIADLAGNLGAGTTNSDNYEVQTVVPTAIMTVADSALTAGETSPVKIVFSEAVTGLAADDFTVDNGVLSGLASADGGITWTAVLTPTTDTNAAVNHIELRNDGFVSLAGNAGVGTTLSNVYAVMTVAPSGGGSASPSVPTDPPIYTAPVEPSAPVVSTDGTLTLPVGRAGTVSLGDAVRIEIPVGASTRELKLTIGKIADTQNLLTNGEVLASPVFALLKNFPENLSKPVKLSLSFDPRAVPSNRKAALFYYDEMQGAWVEVKGGTLQGDRLVVEVDHFAKYAVFAVEEKKPTTDTPVSGNPQSLTLLDVTGYWAEEAVRKAIAQGFVSGYPDGTFRPNAIVTRAEFAVMLIGALNGETSGEALNFTDASEVGAWAQSAVSQAAQLGILTGYADGSVRPNASITRAEMAVMAARAMKLPAGSGARTSFSDDNRIPAWARDAAAALKTAGAIRGTGANTFNPAAATTRAEAVTLLVNLLRGQK
ncbi:hypothetical protein B9G55_07880 [Saccharibacillus sp. O16]|nr:hypothetical protein B9G55_07880 [Saccharibacillus sp. O16]